MVSKKRSPNYPFIDLGKALERTRKLYEKVEVGGFTQVDAAHAWGYKSDNGISRSTIAAMRQYGLIDYKKGDQGRLSQRGLTIALSEPSSPGYQRCVREAAVEPPLFEELFTSGRVNSARDALRRFLVMDKGFTSDGASRIIEVLNATRSLLPAEDSYISNEPDDGVILRTQHQDATPDSQSVLANSGRGAPVDDSLVRNATGPTGGPERTRIPLRLVGGFDAEILLPTEMTEAAWLHMLQYLKVMKDAYVRETTEASATLLDDPSKNVTAELEAPGIEEDE